MSVISPVTIPALTFIAAGVTVYVLSLTTAAVAAGCGDGHRDNPGPRKHPSGPEDPAPPDAPDETEDDVLLQPVASAFHDQRGQHARQHSHENPRHEHGEAHDPSSFTRLTTHPLHFPYAVARAATCERLRPLGG